MNHHPQYAAPRRPPVIAGAPRKVSRDNLRKLIQKFGGWSLQLGQVGMNRLNNPPDESVRCPMCGNAMHHVHVITNGGLWFCESKEYLQYHIRGMPEAEGERMRGINKTTPMHCVIGNSGYTKGYGTWPKDGLYCTDCGTIAVKTKPS